MPIFFINKSQKRLLIFIPVYMLAFWITRLFFVFSLFLKFIFVTEIQNATTLYCFCINLALFPQIFMQLSSFLSFSAFFILVVCISTSPFDDVSASQSLIVVIFFFIRYVSILYAIFFKTCFLFLLKRRYC